MWWRSLACICSLAVLSACGGGGGGGGGSGVGESPSTGTNTAPVANAGSSQVVTAGTVVTLNGGGSSDANGDQLTYSWSFASRPAGSTATLAGATTSAPTFTPDVAGTYVASITVNDGQINSVASTVSINATTANAAPVANAGSPQNVLIGAVVTLNGSASSDANGDPLTYSWSLTSRPAGSTATLAGPTTSAPTFSADVAGTYVASLAVNDGQINSAASTVSVNANGANAAPVANAGSPQNVLVGAVVTLNGSASSDANGDPLTYSWSLTSRPAGSNATLTGPTTSAPRFTADVAGTYVASLAVNDGRASSATATVSISAAAPLPPITNFFLFGGTGNSVYLGCLTCNQFDVESVCNRFGNYGSEFSTQSIWNQFGNYGSQFSSSSPWNQFSSTGPVIIGSDNLFYGYFTTNAFQFNRTTIPAFVNVLNYFSSTSSLAATRTYACPS
jgi:hypothetical protein